MRWSDYLPALTIATLARWADGFRMAENALRERIYRGYFCLMVCDKSRFNKEPMGAG
jgi:hypothetical protein